MNHPVLSLENIEISYTVGNTKIPAVRDISFSVKAGETLGLVGESGSGKSTIAHAVMQYMASNGEISKGKIFFCGSDFTTLNAKELLKIRGAKMAMVPQDPLTSLNPSHKIGDQIAEILRIHTSLNNLEIENKVIDIFDEVHIPMPKLTAKKYPHQISGGQQQRVLIAMAFCTNPTLLIMDEPTTGLDVTTQDRILTLINEMKRKHNTAVLYITHDMGVVKNLCDTVAVLYAGEILAEGRVDEIFETPVHPYTKSLLACIPPIYEVNENAKLETIKGTLPNLGELTPSCIFAPRCNYANDKCRTQIPPTMHLANNRKVKCFFETLPALEREFFEKKKPLAKVGNDLLTIKNLKKNFPTPTGNSRAVDDLSFTCKHGEILGIVGESGCGKTTIARCITGLTEKSGGEITFDNVALGVTSKRGKELSRKIQMVFQNPEATLNPQKTVGQIIGRPLALYNIVPKKERRERVLELLGKVNLGERYVNRYPHEISGGEKQRVGIARSFATNPDLIVLDEPISSLDVSVQAGILNLLRELQQKHGTTYIFIGHNLGVMRHLCDRIIVVYLGRICEVGTPREIFSPPYHPYVEGLLSAIPMIESNLTKRNVKIDGAIPGTVKPIPGCPFHTRCHKKIGRICEEKKPPQIEFAPGHTMFCHLSPTALLETENIFQAKTL